MIAKDAIKFSDAPRWIMIFIEYLFHSKRNKTIRENIFRSLKPNLKCFPFYLFILLRKV